MNAKKIIFLIIMCLSLKLQAQLNPLGAQYFQNQYLANPALAGLETGYEISAALKAQWSAIDGAPLMQGVTLERGSANRKVGFGLNFYNESAGVINRTSLKATYAYHLPLDGEKNIDFGLSAGYMDEWIDFNKVKGDVTDNSLINFNSRKLYFDADFGFAFRVKGLTLQGTVPNLRRILDRDIIQTVVDRSMFMAALSYKIKFKNPTTALEPKVVYRSVQNYGDIIDVGANLSFQEGKLFLNGIFHSTGSFTLGIGTLYNKQLSILAQYTTNTSDLQNYSNGEAQIGLKYRFK